MGQVKHWAVRSRFTGFYHSQHIGTGERGLAPLGKLGWEPVPMSKPIAQAAKRLLERKFKFQLEIIECPKSNSIEATASNGAPSVQPSKFSTEEHT